MISWEMLKPEEAKKLHLDNNASLIHKAPPLRHTPAAPPGQGCLGRPDRQLPTPDPFTGRLPRSEVLVPEQTRVFMKTLLFPFPTKV